MNYKNLSHVNIDFINIQLPPGSNTRRGKFNIESYIIDHKKGCYRNEDCTYVYTKKGVKIYNGFKNECEFDLIKNLTERQKFNIISELLQYEKKKKKYDLVTFYNNNSSNVELFGAALFRKIAQEK